MTAGNGEISIEAPQIEPVLGVVALGVHCSGPDTETLGDVFRLQVLRLRWIG